MMKMTMRAFSETTDRAGLILDSISKTTVPSGPLSNEYWQKDGVIYWHDERPEGSEPSYLKDVWFVYTYALNFIHLPKLKQMEIPFA